ncbi:MAG: hypothetical protein GTN73_07835 [Candidatus Aminicenantes bacterium]|nr:hypothetical protein [Candidatus Aminicenantes bacterium]
MLDLDPVKCKGIKKKDMLTGKAAIYEWSRFYFIFLIIALTLNRSLRTIWARPQSGIRVTTPLNRKFFDSVSKLYGTQQYLKVKKIPGSDALIVQFSGNFPFVQFESTLGVSDPPG